jgi:hypothetical protein
MNDDDAVDYLCDLPEERFVDVLRRVFETRRPSPEDQAHGYCRNHYVLGTAWSERESADGEPERWGRWEVQFVAYVDRAAHGEDFGLGPDWGLCQAGRCPACGAAVLSNVKRGRCPVCDGPVYMT